MTATDGPIGWLTQPPSDMTSATPMATVLALISQPLFNFDTAHGSFLIWSAPFKCSRVCHSRVASNLGTTLPFPGPSHQSSAISSRRAYPRGEELGRSSPLRHSGPPVGCRAHRSGVGSDLQPMADQHDRRCWSLPSGDQGVVREGPGPRCRFAGLAPEEGGLAFAFCWLSLPCSFLDRRGDPTADTRAT